MVNNFDIITPLLEWKSADDYYFLQIIQRKKDAQPGMKVSGTNNNSRCIKTYYIKSKDHLNFVKKEIIELCNLFNARASITLCKKSFKKTNFKMRELTLKYESEQRYNKMYRVYDSAAGKVTGTAKDRVWLIDIDKDELPWIDNIINNINKCRPFTFSNKIVALIPSKTGMHIISKPFDLMEFRNLNKETCKEYQLKEDFLNVDIQKNNPTNLYIP